MSYVKFSNIGKDHAKTLSLNNVYKIKTHKERSELIASHKIVIIDNFTDWCGPCKHIAPKYEELAAKYGKPGQCVLIKENVEDAIEGSGENITSVPVFHFYVDGVFRGDLTQTGTDMSAFESTLVGLL